MARTTRIHQALAHTFCVALFVFTTSGCAIKRSSILIHSNQCTEAIIREVTNLAVKSNPIELSGLHEYIQRQVWKQNSIERDGEIGKLKLDYGKYRYDFLIQKRDDNICAMYLFRKIHINDASSLDSFDLYNRNIRLIDEGPLPECICKPNNVSTRIGP